MRKFQSNAVIVCIGAVAAGTALLFGTGQLKVGPAPAHSQQPMPAPEAMWAAAAPGLVEPKGRELRIGAPAPVIIKEVLVQINDPVKTGDLLVRLDDDELKAKLAAVKAEAAVRTADRDANDVRGAALERRKAEDSLYAAERSAFDARIDLDALISQLKANQVTAEDVDNGRAAVIAANEKVEREQANLKRVLTKSLPAVTREEAALAAARAEVAALSATLERMRIRSPVSATVLRLNAKLGETAGSNSENPLLVLGDTSHLQVRAEVEERDVSKIYQGQSAAVKSDAFPNQIFDARVSVIAHSLGAPRLTSRGQRKQTDVDVLEVVLDLEDGVPLLPGMRADVLFKETAALQKSSEIKAR